MTDFSPPLRAVETDFDVPQASGRQLCHEEQAQHEQRDKHRNENSETHPKHMIEALAVPHTEVGLITVQNQVAEFERLLPDRDTASLMIANDAYMTGARSIFYT